MSTWLINGESFESRGVSMATRQLVSLGASIVNLEVNVKNLSVARQFSFGDAITITRDGVGFFVGKVSQVRRAADDRSHVISYEIKDPWRQLERIIYMQDWMGAGLSPRVILGAIPDDEDGTAYSYVPSDGDITTLDDWSQTVLLLNYATDQGANLQIGRSFTGLVSWILSYENISVADAIKALAKLHPRLVSWFDYSTTPPTLHFAQQFDDDEERRLTPLTLSARQMTTERVRGWEIIPRNDIQASSVVFRFVYDSGGIPILAYEDKAPDEDATGLEEGGLRSEITLEDDYLWVEPGTTATGATLMAWPTGMAAFVYAQLSPLFYEGRHQLKEVDPGETGGKIGCELNLSNGEAAWATMAAVIQTQTEDWRRGTVEFGFGPPAQLGFTDWMHYLALYASKGQSVTPQAGRDTRQQPPSGALIPTTVRPQWYVGDLQDGQAVWFTNGFTSAGGQNAFPDNLRTSFELASNTYFFLKTLLSETGRFKLTGATIVTGASADAQATPDYDDETGNRPAYHITPLGFVDGDGVLNPVGDGGNVVVREVVNTWSKEDGQVVVIQKFLTHHRKG